MSVPAGSLSEEFRRQVTEFYGAVLGWTEIESLRLDDRMTLAAGSDSYVNIRERDEAMTCTGYEHLGVTVDSIDDFDAVRRGLVELGVDDADVTVEEDGFRVLRFRHLLPLAVEVMRFPGGD